MSASDKEAVVIPVVEERLELGKRVVDTGKGVRVEKRIHEREERVDPLLTEDELIIERVPINQVVTGARPIQRYEGETLVVPVFEEVVVVEKKLRLKEEVRITRQTREVHAPITVKLKSEEVSVERFDEGGAGGRHG